MEYPNKIIVDDTFTFDINNSDLKALDVLKLSNTKYHSLINHKSFKVSLEDSDFLNRTYTLSVNSNTYKVKILNDLDVRIQKMGLNIKSSKKENAIKAPMPGLILSINVKEGQTVNEGDVLLILEAMKMENTITAPKQGIVKSIHIEIGKTVDKGTLMIELQ